MHLVGVWKRDFREPLWLMTKQALKVYRARAKIEESFQDLKWLLEIDKVMNKKQVYMEKMVALLLIAYAVGVLIGEMLRDALYGGWSRGKGNGGAIQGCSSCSNRGPAWHLLTSGSLYHLP